MKVNAESIDWQTVQMAGLIWPIKTICYAALVAQAHSLLVDVHYSREASGAYIEGEAIDSAILNLNRAIETLRDCGESPDYLARWEWDDDEKGKKS
jgi:hypothetical protein